MEFRTKVEEDEVNVTLCVNYTHIKKKEQDVEKKIR